MLPPVPWAARPPSGPPRPPLGACLRHQRATTAPSPVFACPRAALPLAVPWECCRAVEFPARS
eukprot:1507418-Alexandrium_andersonii.AAC.1